MLGLPHARGGCPKSRRRLHFALALELSFQARGTEDFEAPVPPSDSSA